jgi:hypothetical protein
MPLLAQTNSYGYNLVEDPAGCAITELVNPGTNITGQDPGLPSLAVSPGACTATQCPVAGPAIDAGFVSDQDCPAGPNAVIDIDQRGLPRPVGGICDIGACELQGPPEPFEAPAPTLSLAAIAVLCLSLGAVAAGSLSRRVH